MPIVFPLNSRSNILSINCEKYVNQIFEFLETGGVGYCQACSNPPEPVFNGKREPFSSDTDKSFVPLDWPAKPIFFFYKSASKAILSKRTKLWNKEIPNPTLGFYPKPGFFFILLSLLLSTGIWMVRAAFFCVDLFEIHRSTDWTCNFFLCTTHKEWRLERKTGNEKPKKKKAKHVWYCNNTSARITPAAMKNVCRSFEECFLFLFLFREIFTSVFFCGRPYNLSCHGWLKVRLARLKGLTEHSKLQTVTQQVSSRFCDMVICLIIREIVLLYPSLQRKVRSFWETQLEKMKILKVVRSVLRSNWCHFFHAENFPLLQPHY